MIDTTLFSIVNVGIGFCVSWLLSHYLLPIMFGIERCAQRATKITLIYTVAALLRNFIVFGLWV